VRFDPTVRFRWAGGEVVAAVSRGVATVSLTVDEPYGILAGAFWGGGRVIAEVRGYGYALPDAVELRALLERTLAPATRLRPSRALPKAGTDLFDELRKAHRESLRHHDLFQIVE
jgi:hypothetical protein